jgi:hypothetical protein
MILPSTSIIWDWCYSCRSSKDAYILGIFSQGVFPLGFNHFRKPQILLETIESISVIFPILKRHTNCFSKMQKNIAKLWYGVPLLTSFCQEEAWGKWNYPVGFQINILIIFPQSMKKGCGPERFHQILILEITLANLISAGEESSTKTLIMD